MQFQPKPKSFSYWQPYFQVCMEECRDIFKKGLWKSPWRWWCHRIRERVEDDGLSSSTFTHQENVLCQQRHADYPCQDQATWANSQLINCGSESQVTEANCRIICSEANSDTDEKSVILTVPFKGGRMEQQVKRRPGPLLQNSLHP